MYISLELAKKHLNIQPTFTQDDDYISFIIEGAEQAVLETCNLQDFSDIAVNGELPNAVKFAILLLVGDMYANRETVAYTTISKIPTFRYLLANFTKYNDPNLG